MVTVKPRTRVQGEAIINPRDVQTAKENKPRRQYVWQHYRGAKKAWERYLLGKTGIGAKGSIIGFANSGLGGERGNRSKRERGIPKGGGKRGTTIPQYYQVGSPKSVQQGIWNRFGGLTFAAKMRGPSQCFEVLLYECGV